MIELPGRASELARIEAVCRAALAGTGRLVLLSGPAGIGKSRLAHAASEHAAGLGMRTALGYCLDDPGAPALWPWLRLAREVTELAGALAVAGGGEADDAARFRLGEAIRVVLGDAAAERGLLVMVEDLQWADSVSVAALRHLVPELSSMPVLVVATVRDDAATQDSPFARVAGELARSAQVVPIPLRGLDRSAVEQWLRCDPDTAAWLPHVDQLLALTGGNPFYIRSLTSELGAGCAAELRQALAARPSWRGVLAGAFRELPGAARHTVATAAVLGERLSPTVLASATGRPVADVSAHLSTAVTAGLLHFGDTGLAFTHALVREAIVAELTVPERANAHATIAAALEATGDLLLAGPSAIHWSRVEGRDAAQHCRDQAACAAATAARALAHEQAVEFARLRLASARTLCASEAEQADILLDLARHEWAAGRLPDALESCAAGIDLADAAGRVDLMADLALVPQGVGSVEVAQTVGRMCRRALGVLPDDEVIRRARLLAQCAVATAETAGTGRPEDDPAHPQSADQLSAQALRTVQDSGDVGAQLETIAARHLVLSYPQAIDERAALAARAVVLGAAATTTMGALWGHLWQADIALQEGDLIALGQCVAEIEGVADRRASPVARWHTLRLKAAAEAMLGHFDEACELARAAHVLAERVGDISMVGMYYAFFVQLALLRGDPAQVPPGGLELIRRAPPIPLVRASVPTVLALRGELDAARAEFAPLRHVPGRMPLGPRWAGTVGQIGHVAILLGDAEVARDCYRLLAPVSGWCAGDGGGSPFSHASNELPHGWLAQTFGDWTAAAGHFRRAIEVDDRLGARPFAALARLGLAECLVTGIPPGGSTDSDPASDAARSRQLAQAAAAEFARLDMPGPLVRSRAMLAALPAAGPVAARAEPGARARRAGLTSRECEVLELVGHALTNQQIAERLFLSVRTVESHVRSILAKLHLTTRTEIAVWLRQ
ncbi:MAG: helix-turn-helix transcriptional regulator [Dermatophilaceae bacterium]